MSATGHGEKKELLVIGGVILLAWYVLKRVGDAAGAGIEAVSTGIANTWVALTSSPRIQVLGNVSFPDGVRVALSALTVKTDSQGMVYTMRNGHLYKLLPHDSLTGDWPAVLVM